MGTSRCPTTVGGFFWQSRSQIEIYARLSPTEQTRSEEPLIIDLVAEALGSTDEEQFFSATRRAIKGASERSIEESALFGSRRGRRERVRLS